MILTERDGVRALRPASELRRCVSYADGPNERIATTTYYDEDGVLVHRGSDIVLKHFPSLTSDQATLS